MTQLLELRERLKQFTGKNEKVLRVIVKFLIAFCAFYMINTYIGYMAVLNHWYVVLVLALLCAFLPVDMTIVISALLILGHLYALSLPLCVVAAILFLFMFCVYFRFVPKSGIQLVLMPILFKFHMPYVLPVSCGLLGSAYQAIAVAWGTIVWFFLKNIHDNAALFDHYDSNLNFSDDVVSLACNQIYADKMLWVYLVAFVASTIIVYIIRRSAIERSWTFANVAGIVVQLVIVVGGQIILGNVSYVFDVLIFSIISFAIVQVIQLFTHHLDYSRVETVQFEDDEYYYYVKAIPKTVVSVSDVQVKKISGKRGSSKNKSSEGGEQP